MSNIDGVIVRLKWELERIDREIEEIHAAMKVLRQMDEDAIPHGSQPEALSAPQTPDLPAPTQDTE